MTPKKPPYDGEERRSPHELCTAHSKLDFKSDIQIVLGGLGLILLASILAVAVETHSKVTLTAAAYTEIKQDVGKLQERVSALEIRSAKEHHKH